MSSSKTTAEHSFVCPLTVLFSPDPRRKQDVDTVQAHIAGAEGDWPAVHQQHDHGLLQRHQRCQQLHLHARHCEERLGQQAAEEPKAGAEWGSNQLTVKGDPVCAFAARVRGIS